MLAPKIYVKDKGKVYDTQVIDYKNKIVIFFDNETQCTYTRLFSEVEFMDNTGMQDKNGKYIYVGDVVKVNGWWDCIVKYNKPTCEFLLRSINGTWCLRDSTPFNNISSIEVLGNEYENKELLKLGITEIKSWSKYKKIG